MSLLVEAGRSAGPITRLQALHLLHESRKGAKLAVISALGRALIDGDAAAKEYARGALGEGSRRPGS